MKLEYLAQAEKILSKCGRPMSPGGVSAVPIPKGFLMAMVLPASTTTGPAVATFTKEITGDTPWVLRAISSDQNTANQGASGALFGVRLQIQLPNGRNLFGGNGIDVRQFAWVGSWRWLQDPELRIEPGAKITVTLQNTASLSARDAVPVNLLFEGAYLYFMQGGERVAPPAAVSAWDRYDGSVNQNILAPAWMSNEALQTPPGYVDEYFVYSTPDPGYNGVSGVAIVPSSNLVWLVNSAAVVTQIPQPFEVQIDPGYEFYVRRALFDVTLATSGFNILGDATVLAKIRTGAGDQMNDSYIDVARLINGAEFPGFFKVEGSDTIYVDVALVDVVNASGTNGAVCFQAHFEGFRRRRIK